MSDSFPVILLVAGIITLVAFIEVLILSIPFRISLSFRSGEQETKGYVAGSWFIFGAEVLVSGKEQQFSLLVGGYRILKRPFSRFAPPEKGDEDGPGPGDIPGLLSSLARLERPALDTFLDLVRHTRLDYARGTARIGLGDPAATGMMYGLYRAVIAVLPGDRVNFIMIPEFSREVLDIDVTSRFRITYPVLVLVNAVKIVTHPAARKIMKTGKIKKAGEVAT
ncbi:MAG: DUF2953 domain-containing protein [Methanoregulaceae archaeon]|jgi:hypothetical protein|nr:DUF2953 domain-containing protein [Methanoregulaceae archaeon]